MTNSPIDMKRFALFIILMSCLFSCTQKELPLVYDSENTGAGLEAPAMPSMDVLPVVSTLPDPLEWSDGSGRVKRFSEWERRRNEIFAELQHYEVGVKPVTSKECVSAEILPYKEKSEEEIAAFLSRFPAGFPLPPMDKDVDTMLVTVKVNGESLQIHCPVILPEGDGPFPAIIGIGQGSGSLPREVFTSRNIAMVAFPFSEVMAHQQNRGQEPINKLYPELVEMGAYAAWPWGVSRVIDALEILGPEVTKIDTRHLAVSGCSFAGKMALWAGAFDERIRLTIAQEPGGGGAAAWRVSETLGYVETLGRTDYHWFKESMRQFSEENTARLPFDHHELCAMVFPRALLVFGNTDYEWLADEAGYVSCMAARKVWEYFGVADRMGFSIQGGHGHCQLPKEQYPELEAFVDRFLLDKEDVCTTVMTAPMFEDVDLSKWINW